MRVHVFLFQCQTPVVAIICNWCNCGVVFAIEVISFAVGGNW